MRDIRRRRQDREKGSGQGSWAALGLVAVVALTAGCSNKVVALAATPEQTTTTVSASPNVSIPHIPSLPDLINGALDANNPSQAEIDKSPINALRIKSEATIMTKLNALNAVFSQLGTISHLSTAGLATERAEISGAVQGLTTLQDTIQKELNIAALRDEASHLADYKTVGTVIVPKVLLLGLADGVLRGTDTLSAQVPGFQAKIDAAAGRGKPVADPQNTLNDLKAQTGQAASQAGGLMVSVPTISSATVSEITTDQNIAAGAKTALNSAQSDVGKIDTALAALA